MRTLGEGTAECRRVIEGRAVLGSAVDRKFANWRESWHNPFVSPSRHGMTTSSPATETPVATEVKVTADALVVELQDGRVVSVPLAWYPRLAEGTPSERRRFELIGPGIGIHWPVLDEDISIEALLRGLGSNESASSLHRWRASRQRPAPKPLQPTSRPRLTAKSKLRSRAARG